MKPARAARLLTALLGTTLTACARHDSAETGKVAPAPAPATAPVPAADPAPGAGGTGEALAASPPSVEATQPLLLGTFTQADVIRAAGASGDDGLMWLTSEWHARTGAIVALSFRPTEFGYPVKDLEPRLFLLQELSGKLEPVARGLVDLSRANCNNDSGEPAGGWDQAPHVALDLARYAIAPGQTALGLRLTCTYTFPAGEGTDTRLYLLEPKDGTLRQVFEATMAREDFQRAAVTWGKTQAVLAVRPTQHAGYFDLRVRSEFRLEHEDPEAGKPSARVKTEGFVWNGERYVPAITPR